MTRYAKTIRELLSMPLRHPNEQYGIKAYKSWSFFPTKRAYRRHLNEWIANTDGAEQLRACRALAALDAGHAYYDSDTDDFPGDPWFFDADLRAQEAKRKPAAPAYDNL